LTYQKIVEQVRDAQVIFQSIKSNHGRETL